MYNIKILDDLIQYLIQEIFESARGVQENRH